MKYSDIKNAAYAAAFNSVEFIACHNAKEFDRVYYNGSTALRAIPMPPIPTLLETWKPGLTRNKIIERRVHLLQTMQDEINAGRERRNQCVICGTKLVKKCCPNGHGMDD